MDEEQRNTLRRTHIAAYDFQRAVEFIEAGGKHGIETLEHEGLLVAAVVHYARPFSNNEERSKKVLPSDRSIAVDAAKELGADHALHERILVIRNKAVAHAEWEYYPTDRIPDAGSGRGIAMQSQRWHIVNERINLDAFARIAAHMRRLCQNRVADFGDHGFAPATPAHGLIDPPS